MIERSEKPSAGKPSGSPKARRSAAALPARSAAILELIHHCLSLEHPFRLIDAHHLLYLFQACGENCGLSFARTIHGPCAKNLQPVLGDLQEHFITGYRPGQSKLGDDIRLTAGAVSALRRFKKRAAAEKMTVSQSLPRTFRLIEGFESPYGLELLATIHWIELHEASDSLSKETSLIGATTPRLNRILQWDRIQVACHRLAQMSSP